MRMDPIKYLLKRLGYEKMFKLHERYEADLCKCPHCNYEENTKPAEPYHLVPGLILNQKYTIGTVIGFGGFSYIRIPSGMIA